MSPYAIDCILVLMLFSQNDCRLHRRNHLIRRQNEQAFQNPNQMIQNYPMLPVSSQFPPAYQNPVYPNPGFYPAPYSVMPPAINNAPGSAEFYGSNSSPVPNNALVSNSTLAPFRPSPQYQNSNFNYPASSSKRRRKNVPDGKNEMEKLLENGKKILQKSAAVKSLSDLEVPNDSLGDDIGINGNATLIPIPRGIELKSVSEHDKGHIQKILNISSTQRTVIVDNNTEIENVVEMQMEKKVEDEKGDNKGSEEVRIVEKELVKPVIKKKWDKLTLRKRNRRFHHWKLAAHHRSKRSGKDNEALRSVPTYNKMARRFLSDLRRKERMVERNGFLNRQEASNSRESESGSITSKVKEITGKPSVEDMVYDNDEMGDFLKHFLDQLRKFKKIRENLGNKVKHTKFSNFRDNWHRPKQAKHTKKIKHHEYPEHMKMVMNMNMTWDSAMKDQLLKSPNAAEKKQRNYDLGLGATDIPTEPTTRQMTLKILVVSDGKETGTRFLTLMLILTVVMFLLTILVWIVPKLYRTAQLTARTSAVRFYRFYHESENEKSKELNNFRRDNICSENYAQLEWQSENGDWLSEKEMDFK